MAPQACNLLFYKPKHEVVGEAILVSAYRAFQVLGLNSVKGCQVGVEHDLLPAEHEDPRLDPFHEPGFCITAIHGCTTSVALYGAHIAAIDEVVSRASSATARCSINWVPVLLLALRTPAEGDINGCIYWTIPPGTGSCTEADEGPEPVEEDAEPAPDASIDDA